MQQIDLQIKREYLDAILSGEKTEEFRECSDHNLKKFCELDSEGNAESIKPLDRVRFFNGYAANRPMAIVEVKEITLDPYEDVNPDEAEPDDCIFVLRLGAVLERANC